MNIRDTARCTRMNEVPLGIAFQGPQTFLKGIVGYPVGQYVYLLSLQNIALQVESAFISNKIGICLWSILINKYTPTYQYSPYLNLFHI